MTLIQHSTKYLELGSYHQYNHDNGHEKGSIHFYRDEICNIIQSTKQNVNVRFLIFSPETREKIVSHPRKYAFFVSQKSLTPTWGNISFCKISFAYLIRFSFVTPGRAPRAPIKFRATVCSCTTNASSRDGLTDGRKV